ncbi:serine hydrolase domain-containing protein [Janthinobacterium sp. RB2R34]|uniref:serine hydrolase domain-containing protein n=1 Tax=Janthinobacterium sp. RB2R34 TaxID=3424193 RepID=UPI003F25BB71
MSKLSCTTARIDVEGAFTASIDAMVAPFYHPEGPGAAVIVTLDGKTVFRHAYGMASVAEHQPATPETTFRLGSISKQFTAVSILMLAEEGKLNVSDEITRHLPDYPALGRQITIEHLLTHSSGIACFTGKDDFDANITSNVTVTEMIDRFKDEPLEFAPGTAFSYSNSGYYLLGAIIEKVSGLSYASFVEQRIFVPLGMHDTCHEGHERSAHQMAAGHTLRDGRIAPGDPMSTSQAYAAGALVSNVDDLARWEQAIACGKLINAASWSKAFTPWRMADGSACDYGYGWEIGSLQQRLMLAHGGGINGFMTFALRLPQENLFVAVLCNADDGIVDPEYIAHKIGAMALGEPFADFEEIQLDTAALDAYAGVYSINATEQRTFWREAGQLLMQRSGGEITPVLAHSSTGFFIRNTLVHMAFMRDADGAVCKVVVHQSGVADDNVRLTD